MLSIEDLFTPLTQAEVLAFMLSAATTLGLDVTAWQDGQIGREQLVIESQKISDTLSVVQTMNKGVFLDYSASVTPEGGPGWLDILAMSEYQTPRIPATFAATLVTFTATNAVANTYAAGTVHLAAGGVTYNNTVALVMPANGTVTILCTADVQGSASTAGAGAIDQIVSPALPGVTCSNAAPAIGTDNETNANLVTRCRSKWASLSTEGPAGAYDYNARTINGPNQVQVSSGPLTQPASPATRTGGVVAAGQVTNYVASAAGAYLTPPNYTNQLAQNIVSSTNASPIVIDLTAHGYATGDQIYIQNHLINDAANGPWTISVVDANHFALVGSTGDGVGGATGTAYRYSDLDLIDKSIQANATPWGVTAKTFSANDNNPTIVGVITVTGATANLPDATIIANAITALTTFASSAPLGDGTTKTSPIFLEALRYVIFGANPNTKNVVLSSPSADVVIAAGDVFSMAPTVPSFTVVRV
jgi:hypothetical protein